MDTPEDLRIMLWMTGLLLLSTGTTSANDIPAIHPFNFRKNVTEGTSFKTFCTASSNIRPLTFRWTKDGYPINHHSSGIKVQSHDDYSVLDIQNVDYTVSGNYTCSVSNSAGSDTYTAPLLIVSPPKWMKEPQDTSLGLGTRWSLDCKVRGHPPPRISWRKITGAVAQVVTSSGRYLVAENGSLTITRATQEDAGQYECSAANGIGDLLVKTITVSVHVPAKFEQKFSVETVRWGETARLRCDAVGDNPITISWTKNQLPLSDKENARYEVFESITERGTTSELHIQVADREDNALYMCIAKNTYGKDERNVKLVVLEVPSPPSDVSVEQTWSQSASVRWSVPYGGNSPINQFIVQYWRDAGAPHRLEEEVVAATQTSTMLRDLQPGSSYVVRVLAENEVGRGNPSEAQRFVTKESEPSAPPTDVTVEGRGAGTLRVKWKAPPKDQWNGQLRGYYIGYRIHGSPEPYSYKTVEFSKQLEEEYKLTILQKSTEYAVIVQAFNNAGSGPASQDVVTKTSDTDPPSPPFLWVESQTRSTITIKWKQKDPKEHVAHYTLSYKDEQGPWTELTVPRTPENQYTLNDLREGTRYQMYLKAVGDPGESDPSELLTVRTEGGALSDMSSHPIVEQGEDVPFYLRISVIAPVGASVGVILIVLLGACFYVKREEKRYKAALAGNPDKRYSYGGSSTLPHVAAQRYVDVDKTRPLLQTPVPHLPNSHIPCQFPQPYATLPLKDRTADKRRFSGDRPPIPGGRDTLRAQATLDRRRMPGHTIQETAEIHHYDVAA